MKSSDRSFRSGAAKEQTGCWFLRSPRKTFRRLLLSRKSPSSCSVQGAAEVVPSRSRVRPSEQQWRLSQSLKNVSAWFARRILYEGVTRKTRKLFSILHGSVDPYHPTFQSNLSIPWLVMDIDLRRADQEVSVNSHHFPLLQALLSANLVLNLPLTASYDLRHLRRYFP